MALGLLTKGLIAIVFPIGSALLFLLISGQLFRRATWKRLLPLQGTLIFFRNRRALAHSCHAREPAAAGFSPCIARERFPTMVFFWFYFLNEQVLRFLGLRYPRDYNTVPRPLFWLLHLVWFFPWSVYLFRVRKLSFVPVDRGSRTRLLALCWIGFVFDFFHLFRPRRSTIRSPAYPAFAILIGAAMAQPGAKLKAGTRTIAVISAVAAAVIGLILWQVRNAATPGDIAEALSHHPDVYTLSMGHMADLTIEAFAYLSRPASDGPPCHAHRRCRRILAERSNALCSPSRA